jgi:hypothetical protein
VLLKRVIVSGVATFQLQWSQESVCPDHRREDRAFGTQQYKLSERRDSMKHQANKNPPPRQTEDPSYTEINDQEEWEVQERLASRTYYRKLQYQVR